MLGIFDSGVGGISVLKVIKEKMPQINVVYFGDVKNAPYGNKTQQELKQLTISGVKILIENGATNILSACNSISPLMSVTEIVELSQKHNFKTFEMIYPTTQDLRNTTDKILLLATQATIESKTYQQGFEKYGIQATYHPVKDLAGAIEFGSSKEEVKKIIDEVIKETKSAEFQKVALCCTHYPLVEDIFKESFNEVGINIQLFNPANPVAKEIFQKVDTTKHLGKLKFLISQDSPNFRKIVAEHFNSFDYEIEVI